MSARGSCTKRSIAFANFPASADQAFCRWLPAPSNCSIVWAKKLSEFCNSALRDLKASTSTSCSEIACQTFDLSTDLTSGVTACDLRVRPQGVERAPHVLDGLNQGVIIAEKAGPCLEHVALECCVIEKQHPQRIEDTFMASGMRRRLRHQ